MKTKTDESWEQAIGPIVRTALIDRVESRYQDLAYKAYREGKGDPGQRVRFERSWERSVEELYYRLRSARTSASPIPRQSSA